MANYRSQKNNKKANYEDVKARRAERLSKRKNNKKPKKKFWIAFKYFFLICIFIGVITVGVSGYVFYTWIKSAPDFDPAELVDPIPSKFYDQNNKLLKEVGAEKRILIEYKDIPELVEKTVLAVEDARFYEHKGVDWRRTIGAVLTNITKGGSQGGSTITQQIVKLSFLTHEKKIKRKVQEWYISYQFEKNYSKEQILAIYLNKIFYGNNAYGIAQAAKTYYGKNLDDLTPLEVALLVGLPQSPTNYNPYKNPEGAKERRDTVLTVMKNNNIISEAEYEEYLQVEIEDMIKKRSTSNDPYSAIIEMAIEEIEEKVPEANVSGDGYKVYLTVDRELQKYANDILKGKVFDYPTEKLQTGFVLLDTKTGGILAVGNGRNRQAGDFNFATQIQNQPGSAMKPLLDYGPAIEYLNWSTGQLIVDEPYTYSDGTTINNWDRGYKGEMTIREALADSRNIPALKTFQAVGAEKAKEFVSNLGIQFEEGPYEAYSIGGFNGLSPLQMAGAYAAFGNQGIFNEPHIISKIVSKDGEEIKLDIESKQAMSPATAYMVTDMMRTVVQSGTGTGANISWLDVAGKTGSTNFDDETMAKYNMVRNGSLAKDVWFSGITPEFSLSVWVGYEKITENTYISTPAEHQVSRTIFKEMMSYAAKEKENTRFIKPSNVVSVTIEKYSDPMALPSESTPSELKTTELFIAGTEPTKVSDRYQPVDPVENLEITYDEETRRATLTWDYSNENEREIEFEIRQTANGNTKLVKRTSDLSYVTSVLYKGSTYSYNVVAVVTFKNGNDKITMSSEPVRVRLTVPEPEPEIPVEPDVPPIDDDTPNEEEVPPIEDGNNPEEEIPPIESGDGILPPNAENLMQ